MKRKRLAAVLTAAALCLTGPSALAAEGADARLARVTLAVKAVLNVGDDYAEFHGEPEETPLGARWSLRWSGGEGELSVTATEEGKILSLNRWDSAKSGTVVPGLDRGGPAIPPMTMAQARQRAEEFLQTVLAGNETVFFPGGERESLSAESYTIRGEILLNGLPTPMTVRVQVRLSDGAVIRFWRDDESDYAGRPAPAEAAVEAAAARALLKSTLSLRLEYALEEGEEDRAVLRYLPDPSDTYYVDAATGELIDLDELRSRLRLEYAAGAGEEKLMDAMETNLTAAPEAAPTLTDTELEGIAKLEGVLAKEALDGKVRAWSELGLEGYALSGVSYTQDGDGGVTARVSYGKNTPEGVCRRYVTVDAKTGELLRMSGYGGEKEPAELDGGALEAVTGKAEGFLTKLWGEQMEQTGLYSGPAVGDSATRWSFTFAQKVDGYFYPGNSLTVEADAGGNITGFSRHFDETVRFDHPEEIVSPEAALDAWCESYPVELAYLAVPVALDLSREFAPLREAGYAYYNALKPGYALGEQEGWCAGVDAVTGEVVRQARFEQEEISYGDLDGHWAGAVLEELARYGVGWPGGEARPDEALTQLDYLKLLAGMDGYSAARQEGTDWDWLYNYAYRRGLLTEEERQEDRPVTRGEMARMFLDSMGYGGVARLPGIFRCDFSDAGSIPESELGYAALAQGLGILSGDGEGRYASGRVSTRAEAAVMVWNYLKR